MAKDEFNPPSECPVCGADVPRGARACPECGADERSGWNEDATRCDGLDLPGEGGDDWRAPGPASRTGRTYLWMAVVLVVALTLALFVRR